MSLVIRNIEINTPRKIDYRNVFLDNGHIVQSVNINQTDGTFVTTEPIENDGQIVIYPQSPNNPLYDVNIYKNLTGYGDLYVPCDARFDYIRRKLWVADLGNSKIVQIETNDYTVKTIIEDIILPHSVIPELNLGGVFIKGFSGINTGIIYYYQANGELDDYLTFPCALGRSSTDVEVSTDFIENLPIPTTMVYDHVRCRLWWTSASYVYMMDVRNRQIVQQDLSPSYVDTRGLDVDLSSGNVFVTAKKSHGYWYLLQIFRDNNYTFCDSYIDGES
jgi:hypothetical protein